MRKYLWLLVLAIPPWVALELDARKWIIMLAVAPFFLFAMTLGDPDEHLLGERFDNFRKPLLVFIALGGLVLGVGLLMWFRALIP
jgi:uncharacterized membrane protein